MNKTITSNTTSGIELSASYNPLTIAAGVTVSNTAGPALFSANLNTYTIVNYGTVEGLGSNDGIETTGLLLTNQSGALISGYAFGVFAGLGGSATNDGTILALQTIGPAGSITSLGAYRVLNAGLYLEGSGSGVAGIVTNASHALIQATGYGVAVGLGAGTVTNNGTIKGVSSNDVSGSNGVALQAGGVVINNQGGTISGYTGISGHYYANVGRDLTVVNDGLIQGTDALLGPSQGIGVQFLGGYGTITNLSNGSITGGLAGVRLPESGSVNNAGSIGAATYGVFAGVRASVSNAGTITASGVGSVPPDATGVYLRGLSYLYNGQGGLISSASRGVYVASGTVINKGVITGAPIALMFSTSYASSGSAFANVLEVAPGGMFNGLVNGANTIGAAVASSLVLLSGASAGTITGLGSQIYNFANVTINSGATWLIGGESTGIAGGETFSGFAHGDELDISGVTNETVAGFAGGTLTLTGGMSLDVIIPGAFSASSFDVQNDTGNGTSITLTCFAEGTRIRTPAGDVAVETLADGDAVITVTDGAAVPRRIRWVGRRVVDLTAFPDRTVAAPIRIRAGALADQIPERDLLVSPAHGLFLDGALIPAMLLVDGVNVVRDTAARHVTYYHIELDEHAVLLAEGAPCESYLDTGDRANFDNGGRVVTLRPNFAATRWETGGCAPLLLTGSRLDRVRDGIARRAARRAAA